MEILLFKDLLIILGVAIVVLLLGHKLRTPPVVGFIFTGVLAGPHGLGLIREIHDVENLAEIGIILLLFGIGMEFSLKKLVQIRRLFLLGGSLQVGLSIFFSFLIGKISNLPWTESLLIGCLIAMSSTAIVLGLLDQNGELSSPHGKLSISILIFQDMIAIPMILMIPFLASGNEQVGAANFDLIWQLLKGVVILAIVFVSAQYFVPKLLFAVARTRNKELFLLTVLTLCFGVAFISFELGLSLTIGAFLAGLIISESEYSNEAISNIFPFQALFISFFFISIGMLLNVDFLFQHPVIVLLITVGVLILKIVTGMIATMLLGLPIRTGVMVGILLSQIGEFSFVLAKTGVSYGLGSDHHYQLFLCVSLLTLTISPLLFNVSPQIASWIGKLPLFSSNQRKKGVQIIEEERVLSQHVIIIGFGISGRNLARTCKLSGIPYIILEMNPETVRNQRILGEPIYYGDATQLSNLEHLNLKEAKAIAILINDPIASKRVVKIARMANPFSYIIVRARFVEETPFILKLGADEVIPDEFGTSIEVFSRVLRQYHVPDEEINSSIANIRADGTETFRRSYISPSKLSDIKLDLSNVKVGSFRLKKSSSFIGKRLIDSDLRNTYGMTVILIRRDGFVLSTLVPETELKENDVIVVIGDKCAFDKSEATFNFSENVPVFS